MHEWLSIYCALRFVWRHGMYVVRSLWSSGVVWSSSSVRSGVVARRQRRPWLLLLTAAE